MNRTRILQNLVVGTLIISNTQVRGTTVIPIDLNGMAKFADTVVVGTVVDVRYVWDEDEKRIHTDVQLGQLDVLAGDLSSELLQIRLLGGTVGDLRTEVHGQPEFRIGDRNLLFLKDDDWLPVVGLNQGWFRLEGDLVRGHDGRAVVGVSGGRLVLESVDLLSRAGSDGGLELESDRAIAPTSPDRRRVRDQDPGLEEALLGDDESMPRITSRRLREVLGREVMANGYPIGLGPLDAPQGAKPIGKEDFLTLVRQLVEASR